MSLTTRLAKLERQDGGDCPECGGTIRMVLDHDAPIEAKACARCGRVPILFTIAIDKATAGEKVDE